MTISQLKQARRLLCRLQDTIRDAVIASRSRGVARLTRVATVTAADTIYAVDKISEHAVLAWFEAEWPKRWPVQLVMEGLEEHGEVTFPRGTPVAKTILKCIIDPIDGTRCIMYDKRSAWSLAGLAPQRGVKNNVSDILVAVMTELPTSKAAVADQLSAVRGGGAKAERLDLRTRRRAKILLRPSQARDLKHGFAPFAKFFPPGKELLTKIEVALLTALEAGPAVFDDQYPSTGGQLYELIVGHDRFVADLRPLVFKKLGLESALACHPYDICTALIAQEAGCVITSPDGKPLGVPLDTTTPVAWVGFANRVLAAKIAPKLKAVLRSHV